MQPMYNREPAVRIAVSKSMALKAQGMINDHGIELNLTQAVNTLLLKGMKALALEQAAKK
jgi:hypothetical protein|tara:strand:- start:131 stop:310 length:180 start_codon:yes stop_codon:yes gene_type:complete